MNTRVRYSVFLVAAAAFALLLLWGVHGLPPFGDYRGPYGDILNRVAVPQRHATDVVTAVNFDYRGLDTIGEEFILFVSVAGVSLLLRTERDEIDVPPPDDESAVRPIQTSDTVRALCLILIAPTLVLGLEIVSHGHLTPGGGFQGGVVLASALVLIYLAGQYRTLHALSPSERSQTFEAIGAGGFVVIGLAGLLGGAAFLQNIIPLGPVGDLYSAGMIPLINLSVGLEVGAGFVLILSEFLRQTLQVRAIAQARERKPEQE
jgi:multicomponent Na+:H+ antiporter subunit B